MAFSHLSDDHLLTVIVEVFTQVSKVVMDSITAFEPITFIGSERVSCRIEEQKRGQACP